MFRSSRKLFIRSFKVIKSSPLPRLCHVYSPGSPKVAAGKIYFQCKFSTTAILREKIYVDRENNHYLSLLKNDERYLPYIWPKEVFKAKPVSHEKLTELSKEEDTCLVTLFETAASVKIDCPELVDKIDYDNISNKLKSGIKTLSDSDVLYILSLFQYFPETSDNYTARGKIWRDIDEECVARSDNWDIKMLFRVCTLWYYNYLTRKSNFVWTSVKRIARRAKNLKPEELVLLMFTINLIRKLPVTITDYDLEFYLAENIDKFNLQESAVISLGGFKSKTKYRNNSLVKGILDKLVPNVSTVHELELSSFCKMFRYSLPLVQSDQLYYLHTKLVNEIPRLSLTSLCQIALSGTNLLIYHDKVIQAISEQFKRRMNDARLKELERFMFALSLYNVNDEEFITQLISVLRERKGGTEVMRHPDSFLNTIHYLTISGYFVTDLLDYVLSPEFVSHIRSKKESPHQALGFIDCSIEIEQPQYTGNRLEFNFRKNLIRGTYFKTESVISSSMLKLSFEIQDVLKEMYGDVAYCLILQHYYHNDFLIGFNENGQRVKPPNDWDKVKWGHIRSPPDKVNKWVCFVAGGYNTHIRETKQPLGSLLCKTRQLETLGFLPVVLQCREWNRIRYKQEYIKPLLTERLKDTTPLKQVLTI